MTAQVAALFVERNGVYSRIPGVDVWDVSRDAKMYTGALPVICHPPCQLWTNLAGVNFKRWGGAHNRPGNDDGCFMAALESVRRCGGVLEHPAGSFAWPTFNLIEPVVRGWWQARSSEWVCEVQQSAYGCKARKRTWLLYVGRNRPKQLKWIGVPGSHQCGFFDQNKPTIRGKEASATPLRFAKALIALAKNCGGAP